MRMKVLAKCSFVIMSLMLLMACGDNDEVENPPENATENNQQSDQENNDQGDQLQTENTANDSNDTANNGYGFTAFDLEADFEELDDALDVDYENDQNEEIEAAYHYKSEGFDLRGDEAMEELDSIFTSFQFDENTPDEEVLNEVSEAFNIPENAPHVELEIDFSNGTEKEYRK